MFLFLFSLIFSLIPFTIFHLKLRFCNQLSTAHKSCFSFFHWQWIPIHMNLIQLQDMFNHICWFLHHTPTVQFLVDLPHLFVSSQFNSQVFPFTRQTNSLDIKSSYWSTHSVMCNILNYRSTKEMRNPFEIATSRVTDLSLLSCTLL